MSRIYALTSPLTASSSAYLIVCLLRISPIYLGALNTSFEATLNAFQYKTEC